MRRKNMDKRRLYILCGCIFPLMVCSGVIYSMFSLYLFKVLGVVESRIGLIYMCGSLAGFSFAPLIGNLADRRGRKIVIIASIASFAIIFLLYSFVGNYKFLYGIQALEGASWVAIGASANAYIADIVSPEKRGWAMGMYQRTMSLGWIIGPAVAGFLFEILGFRTTFLIGAGVTFFSIIPAWILVKERRNKQT
jgi:DHA1 family multidrug resistance protein-like MFS transporter